VCGLLCLLMLVTCGCSSKSDDPPVSAPPIIKTKSGIDMVHIPAGSFQMGSRTGRDDEKPVHDVWVDSFLMDRTEVTQEDFQRIAKEIPLSNPSHFKGGNRPVEQVKMDVALRFCNARSNLEGLDPCYDIDDAVCDFSKNGYRLPTEAEWEYACRAGTDTDYSFGNGERQLGDHAWYSANSAKETHPVAQKKANRWGLFDMHGNVAEWCHDFYDAEYYQVSPEKNPQGPKKGDKYVLRGGSWNSTAPTLRSGYRLGENAGFSDACLAQDAIGFRCVRKAP
jgi:formylglycine-generating enzyme required for sulfatase activity